MVNSEETQIIRKVGGKEETRKFLEGIIANERCAWITSIIGGCVVKADRGGLTPSDKIDRIVTNRILALPIFALVMFGVYYIAMVTVGAFSTDWTNDVLFGEIVPPAIEGILTAVGCADWLSGLILDGIVAGVGAVLGFVPQMFVLFILLAILEGLGSAVAWIFTPLGFGDWRMAVAAVILLTGLLYLLFRPYRAADTIKIDGKKLAAQ